MDQALLDIEAGTCISACQTGYLSRHVNARGLTSLRRLVGQPDFGEEEEFSRTLAESRVYGQSCRKIPFITTMVTVVLPISEVNERQATK